jgi:hypothetical protein
MRILGPLAATLTLAATLGTALADNQPRLGTTPDLQLGQAVPGIFAAQVQCQMGSGDVLARVLIRNSGASAIAPGVQIQWQTSNGQGGIANTGLAGLAPGATIQVGDAPYPFTCSASIAN